MPTLLVRPLLALLVLAGGAAAQRPPEQLDAAGILHRMEKLGVVGSVLYVAAHPDDENTRLISALSNGRRVRAGYLALTRGDGGQNLVGPELGDALGVLRTQELLEARRIDGGEQFFTRAVDFGYSKSAGETLAKWGREEVLADVVRVYRTFRPDVVVTRFPSDGRGGHGHHTASAMLAEEAFDRAADPTAFPEQLEEGLAPWQPRRLFWNSSTWWDPDLAEEVERDPAHWLAVDVGGYEPLLGASTSELAGRSRSQHKSQGFGAAETRGRQLEYLQLVRGPLLSAAGEERDLLEGVTLGWERVTGGPEVARRVEALVEGFEARAPERSLEELSGLLGVLEELAQGEGEAALWAAHHAAAVRELVLQACGLVLEARAAAPGVARGERLAVELSALQRRPGPTLVLVAVRDPRGELRVVEEALPFHEPWTAEAELAVDAEHPIDEPWWLAAPHGALYRTDGRHAGIEPAPLAGSLWAFALRLPDGRELAVERPLLHTWVDRVDGERTRQVLVTPVASVAPEDEVAVVTGEEVTLGVVVEALAAQVSGRLVAEAPEGWSVTREPEPIEALARGEVRRLALTLRRAPDARAGALRLALEGPHGTSTRARHVIDYPHVLPQTWYSPAEVRLVPLEVAVSVATVGYVEGAGDAIPEALQRLGITVERLDPATARPEDLERLDAVVTGIRAYNTVPELASFQPVLLDWVERGGTLVVQYNTAGRDLVLEPACIGPWPFAITRGRVTMEEAQPTVLAPEHPLLTTPNRLGPADFEGWVQERGLYFLGELDPHYSAPIAWSDPGEAPLDGALVSCEHGKGRFVYTGISLFRQLPAGVPGAYRLLANLLARRGEGE